MMGQADLAELADDIKSRGLLESIELYGDLIIDGRNRYQACKIAGVQPHFMPLGAPNDAEALAHIISKNLKRRHLDASQRSMVGARIENLRQGRPRADSKDANLRDLPLEQPNDARPAPPISRAAAAEMVNVSERSINSAKRVIEHGAPEVVQAVESGDLPVSVAAIIAEQSLEEQKAFVTAPKPARKKKASQHREDKKRNPLLHVPDGLADFQG